MENQLLLEEWFVEYDIEYDDLVYCLSLVGITCVQRYSLPICP